MNKNAGTIRCCAHFECVPASIAVACKCCQSYAKIQISVTDMSDYVRGTPSFAVVDSKLLHEPYTRDMLSHDPYTPESIESHSPLPEEKKDIKKQSVSPRILKSRLENILRSEEEVKPKKFLSKSISEHLDSDFNREPYRTRCMTEGSRKISRAKLISSSQSVHRLQSHHSSSDEEWFEFEEIEKDDDDVFKTEDEPEIQTTKKKNKFEACCCLS